MTSGEIAVIIAAIFGGSLLTTVFQYITELKKRRAQTQVAVAIAPLEVETAQIASLTAKLAYLERIIESQSKYSERLEGDVAAAEERARRWENRVRELEANYEVMSRRLKELEHGSS